MPSETIYFPDGLYSQLQDDVDDMDMFDNMSQAVRYYINTGRDYEKDAQENDPTM